MKKRREVVYLQPDTEARYTLVAIECTRLESADVNKHGDQFVVFNDAYLPMMSG